MKRLLLVLLVAVLAAASQASVLVYEGFGDASDGTSLEGYSGTNAEIGLSGTWSVPAGPLDRQSIKARTNYEYVGVAGGYAPETYGNRQHWWEHDNTWAHHLAERPLSGSIDMTVDGTWYMSFFSMSAFKDYVGQVGLNDGTNELMFGNGYSGSSNKGLTAYYGAIDTDATTNGNGTFVSGYGVFPLKTGFYVAKFVKSDSGVTDALDVSIMFYDFGTLDSPTNTIDSGDPAVWTRVVSMTGVSSVFNALELKIDGAGENWPSIDEVRVGESWMDVTVGNVQLIAPSNGESLVPIDTNLEWAVGNGWAVDVYLSDSYNEPNGAPVLSLVDAVNSSELYDPATDFENEKWYYWRVDELEPNTIGYIVHPGQVWSFETIGLAALIETNPVSKTVPLGAPQVQFSVTAKNPDIYQWYKDGIALADDETDTLYVGEDTATLTIYDVQVGDEGIYQCKVDNKLQIPASSTLAQLMTERPVAHWKLDGDLTDSIDEEIDGAPVHDGVCDDPNYVDLGINGGALEFFGNIEGFVKITDSNDFFNFYPRGYTVSAWVNMPEQTGSWGAYVAKQGTGPQRGFILTHNGSGQPVHTLRQSFNDLGSNVDADDNNWHLVVGTYDAGTQTGAVYVDGVLANEATNSGIPQGSPAPLIFGAEWMAGDASYIGALDDVRIYSYPLDPHDIATLYTDFNPGEWVCVSQPELDLTDDCKVSIEDFAIFAQSWLECDRIPVSYCN